jgi:hypothetical protein
MQKVCRVASTAQRYTGGFVHVYAVADTDPRSKYDAEELESSMPGFKQSRGFSSQMYTVKAK